MDFLTHAPKPSQRRETRCPVTVPSGYMGSFREKPLGGRARSIAMLILVSQHLVAATIKRVDETAGADVALGETHRGINDQIGTVAFVEFD